MKNSGWYQTFRKVRWTARSGGKAHVCFSRDFPFRFLGGAPPKADLLHFFFLMVTIAFEGESWRFPTNDGHFFLLLPPLRKTPFHVRCCFKRRRSKEEKRATSPCCCIFSKEIRREEEKSSPNARKEPKKARVSNYLRLLFAHPPNLLKLFQRKVSFLLMGWKKERGFVVVERT